MLRRELELHRLQTGNKNRVQMAANRVQDHVFRYQGHIGAYLIFGGVDCKGPQLIETDAHGVSKQNPFVTTGSGSLAAMAVLETEYKAYMEKEDAVALCVKAIQAGVSHDMGSGNNIDVCIITNEGAEMRRNYVKGFQKMYSKPDGFKFQNKAEVLKKTDFQWTVEEGAQPMEL